MKEREYAIYQALRRTHVFGITHAASFPAGSRAIADFTRASSLLAEIGPVDFYAGVPASGATHAKAGCIDGLWQDLLAIARTARTIALQEPGFDQQFRLGGDSQREIVATAQIFVERLQTPGTVAKFTAYALAPDIVASLQADLAAIDAQTDDQQGHRQEATGDTARVRGLIQEARNLMKVLDASVRNQFRDSDEILAAWRTAARIHRAPASDEPAPPAAPSAS